jgi:hypothetical protein
MSAYSGPEILNDGLVFAYDMANTHKSWKGAPTTNYISNPTNEVIATVNEFTVFQDISPIFDTYGEGVYSISADIKSEVAGPILLYTASGAVEYNIGYYNADCETYYKRFYFNGINVTRTDPGVNYSNLSFYGGYGTGRKPSVKNVQVEKNSFCTPFVVGTRSNTQAIVDLTGKSTVTTGSLTYNSDNTFDFNYSSPGYVSVPLATAFNKLEGTINLWLYPTRYNGGNGYFVNREDAAANAVDWFWIGPYSGAFYFRIGNGSDCCSNDLAFGGFPTLVPLNTWVNMCFTWKANGTSAIYKNGVLYTSRSIGNIPNTNPAANGRFGLGHANADSYYNGKMPVAQIYNRQLTAAEILSNFNALRGRYGI